MENLDNVVSVYKRENFFVSLFECLFVFMIFNSFIFVLQNYYPLDQDTWESINMLFFVVLSFVVVCYLKKYNIDEQFSFKVAIFIYFLRLLKYLIHAGLMVFLTLCFLYSDAKINDVNVELIKYIEKNIYLYGFIVAFSMALSILTLVVEYMNDPKKFIRFYRGYLIYILTISLLLFAEYSSPFKSLISDHLGFENVTNVDNFKATNKLFFGNNIFLVIDNIVSNFITYGLLLILIIGDKEIKFKDGVIDRNKLICCFVIAILILMSIQEFIILCGSLIYIDFNYQYFSSRMIYLSWGVFMIAILTSKTIEFINSKPLLLIAYIILSLILFYFIVTSNATIITYILMILFFIIFLVIPETVKKMSKKHKVLNDLNIGFNRNIHHLFNFFTLCMFVIILILFIVLDFATFIPIFAKLILLIFTFFIIAEDTIEKTLLYKILEIPVQIYYIIKKKHRS
jgi:hypothetical protein